MEHHLRAGEVKDSLKGTDNLKCVYLVIVHLHYLWKHKGIFVLGNRWGGSTSQIDLNGSVVQTDW